MKYLVVLILMFEGLFATAISNEQIRGIFQKLQQPKQKKDYGIESVKDPFVASKKAKKKRKAKKAKNKVAKTPKKFRQEVQQNGKQKSGQGSKTTRVNVKPKTISIPLLLQAIFQNAVIINGKMYKVGQVVQGSTYKLKTINENQVVLSDGDYSKTIKLFDDEKPKLKLKMN